MVNDNDNDNDMKDTKTNEGVYTELSKARDHVTPPVFPDCCPYCGAGPMDGNSAYEWPWLRYKCGGAYEPKPQIQTRVNKWWGVCPVGVMKRHSSAGKRKWRVDLINSDSPVRKGDFRVVVAASAEEARKLGERAWRWSEATMITPWRQPF